MKELKGQLVRLKALSAGAQRIFLIYSLNDKKQLAGNLRLC
jgi:hypothetical protein